MKRILIVLLVLAILAAAALSAGGSAADPVVSQSYLEEVFTPELEADWTQAVHSGLGGAYRTELEAVTEAAGAANLAAQSEAAAVSQRADGVMLLKRGDVLTPLAGCKVALKEGAVSISGSGLVDVTAGQAAGAALSQNRLYMMGTGTARLTVQSATCELTVTGVYRKDPSAQTDYGSLAQALDRMGLFQGTGTGYRLEYTASRAQGLVMFLRILGLEDEALAYSGSCPFSDVPADHWARQYVAYAYAQGLTTGTSASAFSPDRPITLQHYGTFLLRALHYREGSDFTYDTAASDLSDLGLFSTAEIQALSAGAFYRYGLVYLSYYGLFGVDQQTGQLLMNRLTADGTVSRTDLAGALLSVAGGRME